MKERLEGYAPYIALFGLFLLVASPVVNSLTARQGQNIPPQLAPALAIVGAVLVLAWPLLRPADLRALLSARRTRYGGNALILTVSVLGILAAVNFLGTRRYRIWDLTENKQFSISRQTIQIIDSLTEPVALTAIVSQTESRQMIEDLQQLIDKYREQSDKVTLQTIVREFEPLEMAALATRIGTDAPGRGLVAEQGGRHAIVFSFDEQAVTEAIVKATRTVEPMIYFTTGHGEQDPNSAGEGGRGFTAIRQAMEREGYKIDTLTITATLPAADAIIVAGPQRPFLPQESAVLARYVDAGGALMVMADPLADPGLDSVLLPWEIRLHDDLVFDPQQSLFPPTWLGIGGSGYQFHTITKDLASFGSLLPNARSIGLGTPVTSTMQTTALIETPDYAWGEVDLAGLQQEGASPERGPDDNLGPLTLAVAAEGGEDYGRLVVFGTSALVADGVLRQFGGLANGDLFLNSVNWLTQEEDLISIRPTEPGDRPLNPPSNPLMLLLLTTVAAPLAVLAVGAAVWWSRR